ncbi:MAG TPA: hypothetical protein VMV69_08160 [Pirellulales bacterium]|nr:hypothetical protein [Pirellulales bacterium]
MRDLPDTDFDDIFSKPAVIRAAIECGARDALLQHKRAGSPIAVWRDGKVAWIPPEEIEVDESAATDDGASPHNREG